MNKASQTEVKRQYSSDSTRLAWSEMDDVDYEDESLGILRRPNYQVYKGVAYNAQRYPNSMSSLTKRKRFQRKQRVRISSNYPSQEDLQNLRDGHILGKVKQNGQIFYVERPRGLIKPVAVKQPILDNYNEEAHQSHPKRTEILYIRSPVKTIETDDDLERSASQTDINGESETTVSPTLQKALDEASAQNKYKKQVTFLEVPIPGSVEEYESESQERDNLKKANEVSKTVKPLEHVSVDPSEYEKHKHSGEKQATISSQIQPIDINTSPTSVKSNEFSEKSDSDSGIGRYKADRLKLKNSNFMERKSIFTIAYDEIKTRHIKSADSQSGSP